MCTHSHKTNLLPSVFSSAWSTARSSRWKTNIVIKVCTVHDKLEASIISKLASPYLEHAESVLQAEMCATVLVHKRLKQPFFTHIIVAFKSGLHLSVFPANPESGLEMSHDDS